MKIKSFLIVSSIFLFSVSTFARPAWLCDHTNQNGTHSYSIVASSMDCVGISHKIEVLKIATLNQQQLQDLNFDKTEKTYKNISEIDESISSYNKANNNKQCYCKTLSGVLVLCDCDLCKMVTQVPVFKLANKTK